MVSEINDTGRLSAAQNEVSRQILAEEAQNPAAQRLSGVGFNEPLKLDLKPELSTPIYGPSKDPEKDAAQLKFDDAQEKFRLREPKNNGYQLSSRGIKDSIADKVFPGFGRIQSADDKWRLDYIDPSSCSSRAKIGICFKIRN